MKADRETLINIAHTSLATKLNAALAKQLAADTVDAVLTIRPPPPAAGNSDPKNFTVAAFAFIKTLSIA